MHASADSPGSPEQPPWGYHLAASLLVVAIAFALLPSGLVWDYDNPEAGNFADGSWVVKFQWSSLFAIAGLICFVHRERALSLVLTLNPLLRVLLLYCVLTVLWSPFPAVTVKRVIQLFGMALIGLSFQVVRMPQAQFIRLIWLTFIALEVASLLAVIALPNLALEYSIASAWQGGAWRGVLPQKNELGMVCAVSIFFQVALIYEGKVAPRLPYAILCFVLSMLCLLMSKSTTSLLMMCLGTFSYLFFKDKWIQTPLVASRATLLIISVILVGIQLFYTVNAAFPTWDQLFGPFAAILGKQTDLTGRFDIWTLIQPEIASHWLTGRGYGAFWLGVDGPSQFISDELGWVPNQAHNGYLDILNELGLLGLLLFLGFIVHHVHDLRRLSVHSSSLAAFHGALLLIILVSNVTESSIFRFVNFHTNLLFFSSIAVSCRLSELRQTEARRPI